MLKKLKLYGKIIQFCGLVVIFPTIQNSKLNLWTRFEVWFIIIFLYNVVV